jgi:hypothetical protein
MAGCDVMEVAAVEFRAIADAEEVVDEVSRFLL